MTAVRMFAVFVMMIALSACSSVGKFVEESPAAAQLTFQYATAKIVDAQQDRAEKVLSAVSDARQYVSGDASVTVEFLYDQAVDRINWDRLDAADQILVKAILQNASERLQREIGAGILDESQELRLLTVLDWIEDAARGYAL